MQRTILRLIFRISCFGVSVGMALFFWACNSQSNSGSLESVNNPVPEITYPDAPSQLATEDLTKTYCGACHLYPPPELLPREKWEEWVLPNMGYRLGIKHATYRPSKGLSMEEGYFLNQSNIYPNEPLIPAQDWERIVNYYLEEAPEQPLPQENASFSIGLSLFDPKPLSLDVTIPALTTMVEYEEKTLRIFLGDRLGNLLAIDSLGSVADSVNLGSAISDIQVLPNGKISVLTMGIMDPSILSKGKLLQLDSDELHSGIADTLVSELPRPVHVVHTDMDQDGTDEIIVCNFGDQLGRLSWYHQKSGGWQEQILKPVPGAIKSVVHDFNHDQRPDLAVLFGQGNEGVVIFYSQADGTLKEERVLTFYPAYGSSDFQLADFNKDGWMDIVYTNGDNADYSYSLKNYHGVRLFLNQGDNKFKESFFYPLHGASKAEIADFDLDGDLDIVAISFFPDYKDDPLKNFIYLENDGKQQFNAHLLPETANGSWLVMDQGDIDQDGDQDILLGGFIFPIAPAPPELMKQWQDQNWKLLILENTVNQ